MNIASYLARYFLAVIFAVELGYKIIDWNAWVGRFTSLFPFGLPWNLVFYAAIGFVVLEGLLAVSLFTGVEKFITGWIALALIFAIFTATQRMTFAAGWIDPFSAVRNIFQDQHIWMMLSAGFVISDGWREMKRRRRRGSW